ncbi:50S ribosomal protein L23 [Candidatus Saccharibacteria bacterium]|nr:50S ribosomal protein L23 [Candidatus Saccharibacteria bacterium]
MPKTMPLKPRMSEKSYSQSHSDNTYTFDVPLDANKVEIARSVEAQFDVKVETVRISILKGKQARSIRIGGTRKAVSGNRVDVKKAYVRVKEGDSIPIFASIDEAEKKQEKLEKKLAKKTKKETSK